MKRPVGFQKNKCVYVFRIRGVHIICEPTLSINSLTRVHTDPPPTRQSLGYSRALNFSFEFLTCSLTQYNVINLRFICGSEQDVLSRGGGYRANYSLFSRRYEKPYNG